MWKVIKFPDDMSAGTLSGIVQEDKALKVKYESLVGDDCISMSLAFSP